VADRRARRAASGAASRAALGIALLAAACVHRAAPVPASIPPVSGRAVTPYAFRYVNVAEGAGAPAAPRHCLYAHYTGWLTDGTKFDSSRDTTPDGKPRDPIAFPQGSRRVIPGWDAGFEGMRVGGRRRFFIPYQLAYGELGRPPRIPPRAALVFDVELMAVADTLPRPDSTPPAPLTSRYPGWPGWATVHTQ
jgi:peptidylprolyl isomerase